MPQLQCIQINEGALLPYHQEPGCDLILIILICTVHRGVVGTVEGILFDLPISVKGRFTVLNCSQLLTKL